MMKVLLIIAFVTLTQGAYISRMTVNRLRAPTAFRPGVTLQRPWNHQRLVPSASFRQPYVIYRNPPNRYAVKHFATSPRNVFGNGPWKTTARIPGLSPVTPEYEFIRAASAQPHTAIVHANGGAIHTIPAPNLSLSEKPIVVIDNTNNHNIGTQQPRPTYEVTEKNPEHVYEITKIEKPVGFSKPHRPQTLQATPELQNLIRNGAALQIASDYGLSAISLPSNPILPQGPIMPQQFTIQHNFNGIPSQQDLVNSGADGIMITPNALYQPDPMFIQKLQTQLLQRFPSVEFIPYAAEVPNQNVHVQNNQQTPQPELFLLENEELKQTPEPFLSSESKNVIQRETLEGSLVTLLPQNNAVNTTEKETTTTTRPHNITVELIAAESQPVTTTIKYVIESTEKQQSKQNATPIYYAQIGQNVGSAVASGFYSALNEVRAAAALEQVEKPKENVSAPNVTTSTTTTTTSSPEPQPFFVQTTEKVENKTVEMKPALGVPFSKSTDSVKVAYTLVRAEEKQQEPAQAGPVFAGQIVQASITEDEEYNKEKANLIKRAPLRLIAVTEKDLTSTPTVMPKYTVVKAKIPPKSKLTFDEQTGEPVLRIYASYVDSPAQREAVTAKLSNMKQANTVESWKSATVKSIDKTQGFDGNQVTQFGLKLRSRSDDYIPLFDEYEE